MQFGSTTGVSGWWAALSEEQLYNKVEKEHLSQEMYLRSLKFFNQSATLLFPLKCLHNSKSEGRLLVFIDYFYFPRKANLVQTILSVLVNDF